MRRLVQALHTQLFYVHCNWSPWKKIYYTIISIALLQLAAITIINETQVWKSDPYHKYPKFLKWEPGILSRGLSWSLIWAAVGVRRIELAMTVFMNHILLTGPILQLLAKDPSLAKPACCNVQRSYSHDVDSSISPYGVLLGLHQTFWRKLGGFIPIKLFMEKPGDFYPHLAVTVATYVSSEVHKSMCPSPCNQACASLDLSSLHKEISVCKWNNISLSFEIHFWPVLYLIALVRI